MRFMPLLLAVCCQPVLADEKSGAQVYASTCRACHGNGTLNAPIAGNTQQWARLIEEGLDDLVPMALNGIRQMPAKGGNPQLSDLEVSRGVVFMANRSGGQFAEPRPADARRWRKLANALRQP